MPIITRNANDARRSVLRVLVQATEPLTAGQISELLGHPRLNDKKNTGWMSTVSTALGQLQSMNLAQVQYKRVKNGNSHHSYHIVGHWTITPERGRVLGQDRLVAAAGPDPGQNQDPGPQAA